MHPHTDNNDTMPDPIQSFAQFPDWVNDSIGFGLPMPSATLSQATTEPWGTQKIAEQQMLNEHSLTPLVVPTYQSFENTGQAPLNFSDLLDHPSLAFPAPAQSAGFYPGSSTEQFQVGTSSTPSNTNGFYEDPFGHASSEPFVDFGVSSFEYAFDQSLSEAGPNLDPTEQHENTVTKEDGTMYSSFGEMAPAMNDSSFLNQENDYKNMRGFMVEDPSSLQPPTPLILLPISTRISCSHIGCAATYTRQSDLCRHRQSMYTRGLKMFRCVVLGCGITFTRSDKFRDHQMSRHPNLTAIWHRREVIEQPPRGIRCTIKDCLKNNVGGYSRKDKLVEHMWRKHAELGYKRAGAHFCTGDGCPKRNGMGFSTIEELDEHMVVKHPSEHTTPEKIVA